MSLYPGDPPYTCSPHATVPEHGYSVQSISLCTHTGTHVDAPSHFFADAKSIDQIPLPSFIRPAIVVDVSEKVVPRGRIIWDDFNLSIDNRSEPIVLIRTDWSKHWGKPEYVNHPFLDAEAARQLVARGVSAIGIDTLSPDETEGAANDFGVHQAILGAGGLIVENLKNLAAIPDGAFVNFVPLNLKGGDGSPVRAFAYVP
ncbi:putative cyclase [Guyanagaster necrorhizus]|uniref:Cyclase n=1 Tax=Guyanagaster necrorhizus TaxID=856835 RepID=A0A9P7W0B2_9AGAR|nr:putative cyclase [Guyanagaster necrorhizus MCA 3950]KAG7449873.1 putative cyclase [Guyanagaster necrorhizus MCA 3950]